jgi:lysophospholipid acyltransferase (LPLAT)-like uncharacterized protein
VLKRIYKNFIRKLLASRLIGLLIYLYISTVFLTSRRKIVVAETLDLEAFNNESSICVFWHGRMILMYFLRPKNNKTNIFSSSHADGKIIGTVSKLFKINVVWGSPNKNPFKAMREIFSVLKKGESLAITPDGPRGPAFEINSNIVRIASKYNLSIVPLTFGASRKKSFSSWDRFVLPLPFGKLTFIYGNPIKVQANVTNKEIENINSTIKKELNAICQKADQLVEL